MSARPAAGPQTAPFGSWRSPISSDLIVAGSIGFGLVQLDGDDTYWVEQRPSEGGRNVIVRRTADGRTGDITPAGFNARTRVHEYGGGAYSVSEGVVWFSNYADQRLYRQGARVGCPTRVVAAGSPVFHVGSQQLVEPVPLARSGR